MRQDEAGNPCPATLGEYRALCAALARPLFDRPEDSEAVAYLDRQIAKLGCGHVLRTPDADMRAILLPILGQKAGEGGYYRCGCGTEIVIVVSAPRPVQPGDMMLCNHCGAVARYGPDLKLAPVADKDLDTVTRAMVAKARAEKARRRPG